MRAIFIQTSKLKVTYIGFIVNHKAHALWLTTTESQWRMEDPFICLLLMTGVSTFGVVPQALSLSGEDDNPALVQSTRLGSSVVPVWH